MENCRQFVKFIAVVDVQLVGDLTGSLNRPLVNIVVFLMRTTKELVEKSCVEHPESSYRYVSYSGDELPWSSAIIWSFCLVFFTISVWLRFFDKSSI